jgi:hypothetical protein
MFILKEESLPKNSNSEYLTIYPYIFTKHSVRKLLANKDSKEFTVICIRHEVIHLKQQAECLIVFAFLFYLIEWFIKAAIVRSFKNARYLISFEQEAYRYEKDNCYLDHRKRYSWLKYIFNMDSEYRSNNV